MKRLPVVRGCIRVKNKRPVQAKGAGFKAIMHKRMDEEYDPNVEALKESLHSLSMKGSGVRSYKKPASKSQAKYITF